VFFSAKLMDKEKSRIRETERESVYKQDDYVKLRKTETLQLDG